MRKIELLETVRRLNKPYYTIADLEKITGLPRNSLYVALKRWVSGGILEKAVQGIYLPMGTTVLIERIASQIYIPSYLSFESALSRYGILNLIPYMTTFTTSWPEIMVTTSWTRNFERMYPAMP